MAPEKSATGRIAAQSLRAPSTMGAVPVSPSASFDVPPIMLESSTIIRGVGRGTLKTTIPMKPGAKVGSTTVREDSQWVVYLSIKDGKVVPKETRIAFEKSDGSAQTLDGFGPFDMKDIYIGDDGKLYANVICFPDKEVTEVIFGKGVTKVPMDAGEFVAKMSANRGYPKNSARIAGTHFSVELGEQGPQFAGRRVPLPPLEPKDQLSDALELDRIQIELVNAPDGTSPRLKAGWLELSDRAAIRFNQDNRITKFGGSFANVGLGISGTIDAIKIGGDGSLVTGGKGRIELDLDVATGTDGKGTPNDTPQVVTANVRALELADLQINTTTANGPQVLKVAHIDGTPEEGAGLALRYTSGGGGTKPALLLDVSDLEVKDIGGTLTLKGPRGQRAPFVLGRDSDAAGSVTIERLRLDTEANELRLAAELDLDTKLPAIATSRQGLNASLNGGRLRGRVAVDFHDGTLNLASKGGTPFTVTVDGEAATSTASVDGQSTVSLDRLRVNTRGGFTVAGAAEFQLSGKTTLALKGSTSGTPPKLNGLLTRIEAGRAQLSVPLQPFKHSIPLTAALGDWARVEIATRPDAKRPRIEGALTVSNGGIDESSKLSLNPPLRLRIDLGAPNSDSQESFAEVAVDGLSLRRNTDGTIVLWPNYTLAGALDDVLAAADSTTKFVDGAWPGDIPTPSAALQQTLSETMTQLVFGESQVEPTIHAVVAALQNKSSSNPEPSTSSPHLTELMSKARMDEAVVQLDEVRLSAGPLDVGAGTLNLTTKTTMSGTAHGERVSLRVNADLASSSIGTGSNSVRFDSGRALIALNATRKLLEGPLSVSVRDLYATGATASQRAEDGSLTKVTDAQLKGAQLSAQLKPTGEVTFDLRGSLTGSVQDRKSWPPRRGNKA